MNKRTCPSACVRARLRACPLAAHAFEHSHATCLHERAHARAMVVPEMDSTHAHHPHDASPFAKQLYCRGYEAPAAPGRKLLA